MDKIKTRTLQAAVLALSVQHGGSVQAEPPQTTWADLRQGRPEGCVAFLESYLAQSDCAQQTLISRVLPQRMLQCSPGYGPLDGQTIKIAGYVHPLEFEFNDVRKFLLIPRLRQDCRHPPPPLPDQVIAVEFPEGISVNADPIWVIGELRLRTVPNHLAPASYALEATSVAPATIPDVPGGG